jgi:5'-3' exonuclease
MTADEILLKKILKGDDSDNIPSIVGSMSETNIIELIKDSSKLEKWLMEHSKKDVFENNQRLIDFSFIPDNIKQNILNQCLDIIPEIKESVEDMKKVDEKPKGVLVDFPTEFWKNMDKIKVKTKTGIFVFNNYYRTNYRRNYLNYKNYGFRRYTNFNYASEQYYFQ